MMFRGWITAISAAIILTTGSIAAPAPAAIELGAERPIAEASHGFIGAMSSVPTHGPAGTVVTVYGEGLPPGENFDLVWNTVEGSWMVEEGLYKGREFTPKGYLIAAVTSDADGRFSKSFITPDDFGFLHDITLQQDRRLINQTGYSVDLTMTLSPESGPLGTPINVEVHGLGWRYLENSWTLVYGNSFTGWLSSVTTSGTANFTIPATGAVGTQVLRLVHAGFTYPYLNPEQNPYPDRVRPRAEFELTRGKPVLPPPLDQQTLAAVRGLPEPGDFTVTPAFTGVGQPVSVQATSLQPGKSYQLEWGTLVGNRVVQNGWTTEFKPIGTAIADEKGRASFAFDTPDDLGGAHELVLATGADRQTGRHWITPTALPLDVASGPAGTTFKVHIKGGGWSETANIYHVTYDNTYLGYVCAFNSSGDLTIYLTASGEPGPHYIDVYPGIYKGTETQPNNYRVPQLTFAADHPGEDLPAFHFAFTVTDKLNPGR
ncbi:hypothetical protein [Devosia sp. 1566]|uniref:hypothetical protein n=1 Tax=Devosia sp. 1566 TaxID=2499144 RepID=UPI0013E3DC9D|nr:hypothetical protein [Devosia sp. 1566]